MNDTPIVGDAELIITKNKLEWDRLCFLLNDHEANVLWINCDTGRIKSILPEAISHFFPQLRPYNIYLNSASVSLNGLLLGDKEGVTPKNSIIHVFGLEEAINNTEFLGNLNFQRDSTFRDTPATIIFWADITTGTTLIRKAYDFWSWIVFSFDFNTPSELLTARQKGFNEQLLLEENVIKMPQKDSSDRIKHLELEWDDFLKSVNGQPSTVKQMKDAVTIVRALAMEYREDGIYKKSIDYLESLLNLNQTLIPLKELCLINNDLAASYFALDSFEKSKELYYKALNGNISIYGNEGLEVARNKSNLGLVYIEICDSVNAELLLKEALNIFLKKAPEDITEIFTIESNLAMVFHKSGRLNEAKDVLESLLTNEIKLFVSNDTRVSSSMGNLGIIYYDLGEYVIARKLIEAALGSDLVNYHSKHLTIGIKYYNLANVCRALGDTNSAKIYMSKYLEISKELKGIDNKHTIDANNFLASLSY